MMVETDGYYTIVGGEVIRVQQSWWEDRVSSFRTWLLVRLAGRSSVIINVRGSKGCILVSGQNGVAANCEDISLILGND